MLPPLLIQAKPLAAIHWLIQPGHAPAMGHVSAPAPHAIQTPSELIHGLNTVPAGSGGTGMLAVFRPRSRQTDRTAAHLAQSHHHL